MINNVTKSFNILATILHNLMHILMDQ